MCAIRQRALFALRDGGMVKDAPTLITSGCLPMSSKVLKGFKAIFLNICIALNSLNLIFSIKKGS